MDAAPPWGLVNAGPIIARSGPGDAAVAAIASDQHGLITAPQLLFAGVPRHSIAHRSKQGRLHSIHRGVYLVGHSAITDIGRMAAAVLACGPSSFLSHSAAAFLWRLLDLTRLPDVTVIGAGRGRRPGIVVHKCNAVNRRDLRRLEGIPLASPALTLLGVAETCGAKQLESALNKAHERRLVHRSHFAALRARTPGRRGWAELEPLLQLNASGDFSREEGERELMRLIRTAGLPHPRRNVVVHGHELDFFWPELRLNVELDGYQWHSARHSLDKDRDRDTDLAARGIQVVRFTRDQLHTPELVVARLAAAIALRAALVR